MSRHNILTKGESRAATVETAFIGGNEQKPGIPEVCAEKRRDCQPRQVSVTDHTGRGHSVLSKKRDKLESRLSLSKRIRKWS